MSSTYQLFESEFMKFMHENIKKEVNDMSNYFDECDKTIPLYGTFFNADIEGLLIRPQYYIPPNAFKFKNLKKLIVESPTIECVGSDIIKLENLKILDVSSTCLKELPDLSRMKNLKSIYVPNTLTKLPPVLPGCAFYGDLSHLNKLARGSINNYMPVYRYDDSSNLKDVSLLRHDESSNIKSENNELKSKIQALENTIILNDKVHQEYKMKMQEEINALSKRLAAFENTVLLNDKVHLETQHKLAQQNYVLENKLKALENTVILNDESHVKYLENVDFNFKNLGQGYANMNDYLETLEKINAVDCETFAHYLEQNETKLNELNEDQQITDVNLENMILTVVENQNKNNDVQNELNRDLKELSNKMHDNDTFYYTNHKNNEMKLADLSGKIENLIKFIKMTAQKPEEKLDIEDTYDIVESSELE